MCASCEKKQQQKFAMLKSGVSLQYKRINHLVMCALRDEVAVNAWHVCTVSFEVKLTSMNDVSVCQKTLRKVKMEMPGGIQRRRSICGRSDIAWRYSRVLRGEIVEGF
jgi:hypothetical protein